MLGALKNISAQIFCALPHAFYIYKRQFNAFANDFTAVFANKKTAAKSVVLNLGRALHRWGPGKIAVEHGDLRRYEPILVGKYKMKMHFFTIKLIR